MHGTGEAVHPRCGSEGSIGAFFSAADAPPTAPPLPAALGAMSQVKPSGLEMGAMREKRSERALGIKKVRRRERTRELRFKHNSEDADDDDAPNSDPFERSQQGVPYDPDSSPGVPSEPELALVFRRLVVSSEPADHLEAMVSFRKALANENQAFFALALQPGVIERICDILVLWRGANPSQQQAYDREGAQLVLEAAWVITNLAYGGPLHLELLLRHAALARLLDIVTTESPSAVGIRVRPDVFASTREQALWALGNIAAESEAARGLLLELGIVPMMMSLFGLVLHVKDQRELGIPLSHLSVRVEVVNSDPNVSLEMAKHAGWMCCSLTKVKDDAELPLYLNYADVTLPIVFLLMELLQATNPDVIMDAFNALATLFEPSTGTEATSQQQQQQRGRRMCGDGSRYQYSIPIEGDVSSQCMRWAMELGLACKLAETLDPSFVLLGAPRSNVSPLDMLEGSVDVSAPLPLRGDPGCMTASYRDAIATASSENGRGAESIFVEVAQGLRSKEWTRISTDDSDAPDRSGSGHSTSACYNFGLDAPTEAQSFNFSDVNWSSDAEDEDCMQIEEAGEEASVWRSPSSSVPMLSLDNLNNSKDAENMHRPRSFDIAMGSARSVNLSPLNSAVGSGRNQPLGESSSASSLGLARKAAEMLADDEMEEDIMAFSNKLPPPTVAADRNMEFMHMHRANRLQNKPARLSAVRVAALMLVSGDDLHHLSILLPSVDLVGKMMHLVMADVDLFRTHYDAPTAAAHGAAAKQPTNTYNSYVVFDILACLWSYVKHLHLYAPADLYRVLTEGRLFEALDYFFYRGDFEETIASGDVMMPLVVKLCTQHRGVMAKLPFSTHKLIYDRLVDLFVVSDSKFVVSVLSAVIDLLLWFNSVAHRGGTRGSPLRPETTHPPGHHPSHPVPLPPPGDYTVFFGPIDSLSGLVSHPSSEVAAQAERLDDLIERLAERNGVR